MLMMTARPKRTLLFVLLFVVIAGVVGGPIASSLQTEGGFVATESGSARAQARIEAATSVQAAPGVVALMRSPEQAAEVRAQLQAQQGIASVSEQPTLSHDGTQAYLLATLRADAQEDDVAAGLQRRFEHQDVLLGGSVFAQHQIGDAVSEDLGRAEMLAFPVLLLLSLLFFRGRATILPLVVGMTTVVGTFLTLTAVNQVYSLSIFALNLVIGLGLGLAIDYTLFLVTRFREELAKENPDAVRTTVRTAGRTVAFSAVTVAPAIPIDFRNPSGKTVSVTSASATVTALKATVRPAVRTVVRTASGLSFASSSRKRVTRKSV